MIVKFSPPDISDLEIKYVSEVLKSGWITTGPKTKELERKIATFCQTERAVCLNSQTACSEMVLRLFEIGEGDEVITTAYTYTASASVICHTGAKVVLVDTKPNSVEIDYDAVERAITSKTKVIIPVDIAGIPCDYDRLFEIVEKKKDLFKPRNYRQKALGRVMILADTAHAFGAMRNGKPVGSIADFSSFSFHAVKNLTTAEGGALTWRKIEGLDSEDIYNGIQLLSLHGQNKDALAKTKFGAWEYDIVGTWYKCNMTDIMAAIGLAQFERYPEMLKRRKQIIQRYDEAFLPIGVQTLKHYTDEYSSSGHLYITRVPTIDYQTRGKIIDEMAARGVACNVHYKPLPMHTAYKNLGFKMEDYKNAFKFFENEITLPLHTCLTDEEVEYVIKNYVEVVKKYTQCD